MNWLQTGQQKIQKILGEQLPHIKKLFAEKIPASVFAKIQDDESMTWASQKVYEMLPLPVRIVVKEQTFVEFCLTNRNKLLPSTSALQLSAEDIESLFRQGMEHYGKKEFDQAIDYLHKAATQGHAVSQNNLGTMYAQGVGVKKDLVQAEQWLQRAATQGHKKAQKSLEILSKKTT